MIARIWHGRTPATQAEAYLTFLHERAVPDYAGVEGCLGVYVLHRVEGEVAHFQTLTFWTDEDAARAFAGDDVLRAKYYAEDDGFLLEKEPEVRHFEVRGEAPAEATEDPQRSGSPSAPRVRR